MLSDKYNGHTCSEIMGAAAKDPNHEDGLPGLTDCHVKEGEVVAVVELKSKGKNAPMPFVLKPEQNI